MENDTLHFDKILILKGEVLAYGAPNSVMKPENLTRAFGGAIPVFARGDELLMFSKDKVEGVDRGHR